MNDVTIINVIWNLANIILRRIIISRYIDLGNQLVVFHINEIVVPNTLINMGVATNIMEKETILKFNLQVSLLKTYTMLQPIDKSTIAPKGIIEYLMVSLVLGEISPNSLSFIPRPSLMATRLS